jgi:hypothetical protein
VVAYLLYLNLETINKITSFCIADRWEPGNSTTTSFDKPSAVDQYHESSLGHVYFNEDCISKLKENGYFRKDIPSTHFLLSKSCDLHLSHPPSDNKLE